MTPYDNRWDMAGQGSANEAPAAVAPPEVAKPAAPAHSKKKRSAKDVFLKYHIRRIYIFPILNSLSLLQRIPVFQWNSLFPVHRNASILSDLPGSMHKGPYHVPRCLMMLVKVLDEALKA